MEAQFEIRYYSTHNMLAEFARKYSVGPRWPIVIVFWIIYLFVLIPCIVNVESYDELPLLIVLGVIMLAVGFMPHFYTWSVFQNVKKQNDGVQPETIITFGDVIEMHEGMVHLTIEYRKIVRVVRLKHSYMLMLGKRNGIMLRTDCFTKGTFEEFKQFLQAKRPDLVLVA